MINKIEIDGYRLLDGFTADFKMLNVVIGANSTGKSTLLDFFQCVARCMEMPLNSAMNLHSGINSMLNAGKSGSSLSWKIAFDKPAEIVFPAMSFDEETSFYYEVRLNADKLNYTIPQYELLRSAQKISGCNDFIKYIEVTPQSKKVFDAKNHLYRVFDEARPESGNRSKQRDQVYRWPIEEPELLLSKLRFANEFPIPHYSRSLLSNVGIYPGFDLSQSSALKTKASELKAYPELLQPDGHNLGSVLHQIKTRYEFMNSAETILTFFKAAYPQIEGFSAEPTSGVPPQILIKIRDTTLNRLIDIWESSDGMIQFLCLATALLTPLPPSLIAIDEPESGFHPRLLPIIADMIKTAAERTQVIVTTHSPDLLNRFDISDVAIMTRDEDAARVQWHRPGDRKTLVKMLESVEGDTLGDLHRSGELEAME